MNIVVLIGCLLSLLLLSWCAVKDSSPDTFNSDKTTATSTIQTRAINNIEQKSEKGQNDLTLSENDYTIKLPEGVVHFIRNDNKIMIKFKDDLDQKSIENILNDLGWFKKYDKNRLSPLKKNLISAELKEAAWTNYEQITNKIEESSNVIYTAPVLIYKNKEQSLYDTFYVKVRTERDLNLLNDYAIKFSFTLEKGKQTSAPLGSGEVNAIYFGKINKSSAGNSFEIAKYLQSLNLFEFVEPDFIYTMSSQ